MRVQGDTLIKTVCSKLVLKAFGEIKALTEKITSD